MASVPELIRTSSAVAPEFDKKQDVYDDLSSKDKEAVDVTEVSSVTSNASDDKVIVNAEDVAIQVRGVPFSNP